MDVLDHFNDGTRAMAQVLDQLVWKAVLVLYFEVVPFMDHDVGLRQQWDLPCSVECHGQERGGRNIRALEPA
jgi:hypothetical protein